MWSQIIQQQCLRDCAYGCQFNSGIKELFLSAACVIFFLLLKSTINNKIHNHRQISSNYRHYHLMFTIITTIFICTKFYEIIIIPELITRKKRLWNVYKKFD